MKKILVYAGKYRKKTYAAIATLLAAVLANILPFWLLYQIITPVILHESLSVGFVLWRVAAIAALCGINAVLYIKGLALSHEAAYHTLENLRVSLQHKLEKQPLGVIQSHGTGALKKMFTDDIETIELLMAHALPEGVANLAVPIFVYIAMFFVDWRLALLALCSLPIGLLAMGAMYKSGTSKMGAYYGAAQKMNNTIVEYINGMEVVKIFNRDGESYKRFEGDVTSYRDFTLAWYKACWPWMALYTSVLPCTALVLLPLGAYFVLTGLSTLPALALVLLMGFGIGAPMVRAVSFMSTIPQINYKIEALEKTLDAPPLTQSDRPFEGKDYTIAFENVTFAYEQEQVLNGVTLTAAEGSLTALVGESGSGKSTLAKLLVHFYDVTGGSLTVGGQDIRDMSVEALNEQIAYVAQEQFLFNTSLMENIRMGRPGVTDEEVLAAADKAQCGDFLQKIPGGIHAMAGDSGKMLSGGERQRISLARAILKDAPIIVLDEATAFMDPENEEKMNAAIAEVIRDKTVLVIAHRLPSIVNADQICVLKGGKVAGIGTHQKLLEDCSEYKKLWNAAQGSAEWKVSSVQEVEA